jgi:uncharacterized membrane protein
LNIFKKYWYSFLLLLIILFGVLLRLKGLLLNPSMWHDECALAYSIKFKNYSEFFEILRFGQMAPPFFMVASKLMTQILGFSDIVLRLLPFLAGIISIVAFYLLASTNLKSKFAVICAVFFFAINQQLINYSFEFKPYNFDVLFTIICLLFFVKLNIEKLSMKKILFYGILLSLVPWFSFVSIFIIASGFLNLFFKNIKSSWKQKLFLIIPIIISGLIYLKIYLVNTYYGGSHMISYWQNNFLNANPFFFLHLLVENMKYFFFPSQYALFMLILLIWGTIIFLREKSPFINISLTSFMLLIIASFLHLYPFSGRLILFLLPIFLLLILKSVDIINLNKKIKSLIVFFLVFFSLYPQIIYAKNFIFAKSVSKGEYPREMMEFLVKNLKKDDIIVVNKASNTEFAYYSSFYDIKNQIIQEPQHINHSEFFNSLKKNNYYWFYIVYGNSELILETIKKQFQIIKIIKTKNFNDYLIYAFLNPLYNDDAE